MNKKKLEPIHPGEILEEEFMRPIGLSANELARRIDVPVTRVSEMIRGRRGVTADTALRLARFFGTSADLWLGLQSEYDLRVARRDVGDIVVKQITPLGHASASYGKTESDVLSGVRERAAEYGTGLRKSQDRRRIRRG